MLPLKAKVHKAKVHVLPLEAKVHVLLISGPVEKKSVSRLLARARKHLPRVRLLLLEDSGRRRAGGSNHLTPRQREVLRGIATGVSMREIARLLNVSVKTAETHRQLLIKRIGVRHVPGLVRYALRTGLVPISWLGE
jgi:DNA-binding NarL/FixJ family response regulator